MLKSSEADKIQTTDNRVLGGRILLRQPTTGFRSGSDAVLLAAACHPKRGGHAVELGCGTGSAMLCLAWRRSDVTVSGLEVDQPTALIAADNIRRNGMARRGRVFCGNVASPPPELGKADLVLANPPYFLEGRYRRSPDPERDRARAETTATLADWVQTATDLLNPDGEAIFIFRKERQKDLLQALNGGWQPTIRPVLGNPDKPAKRILVRLRQKRSDPDLPPLRLHHPGGAETHLAGSIFRTGAPIFWPSPLVSGTLRDT